MYTLKDFLSLKQLHNAQIIYIPDDLSEIEINYISAIEPPVEDFVRENELVLSSALGCTENDEDFLNFVKEIQSCRPAALALSFKPESKPVPICVSEFAKKSGLPIIRLPWKQRFAEIIELVLSGIKSAKNTVKIEYENIQKNLLNLFLSEKPINDAIILISHSFNVSVEIYGRLNKIKASEIINKCDLKAQPLYFSEIKVNGYLYGYIKFMSEDKMPKIEINSSLIESCICLPLSLWFNKEDVVSLTELRIKNDYVLRLSGGSAEMDILDREGKKLGFNISLPYTAIVFKALLNGENSSITNFFNDSELIEGLILNESGLKGIKTLITSKDGIFIMYVQSQNISKIDKFIECIDCVLYDKFPKYKFFWGIGEIPSPPLDFSSQYKKALMALEQCICSNIENRKLTYKQSRLTSVIYQTASNSDLKNQALQVINKITKNDTENTSGMNLILTLSTFLKCGRNSSLAARELHLHRQSLLYRLNKIEQLTDFSLSNTDDLFLLEFYLRILSKY